MEPKAAPRTPKEEMLARREARAEGSCVQFEGSRLKSSLKEVRPIEALKPPSS